MQADLSVFKSWCDRNQLTMNIKKTKYVIFGLKSKTSKTGNHSLFINDRKLERVTSYKYLGLRIDRGSRRVFGCICRLSIIMTSVLL